MSPAATAMNPILTSHFLFNVIIRYPVTGASSAITCERVTSGERCVAPHDAFNVVTLRQPYLPQSFEHLGFLPLETAEAAVLLAAKGAIWETLNRLIC